MPYKCLSYLSYSCHLLLGEIKHASVYFIKCQEVGSGVCLDRRVIVDASDGQRKAQVVTIKL